MAGRLIIMAESDNTTQEQTETHTAQDLQIEQLNKRLNEIESNYQARIKELEDANRGLWAQLHPAQESQAQAEIPQQDNRAEKALFNALGLKMED